jgi:hypothetical protein
MQCPNCSNLCRDTDRICASCRQPLRRPGRRADIVSRTAGCFALMGFAVMSVIALQRSEVGVGIAGCLTVGIFTAGFAGVGAVVGHVIAFVVRA